MIGKVIGRATWNNKRRVGKWNALHGDRVMGV